MVLLVVLSGLVSFGASCYDKNTGLCSNPNSNKNQNLDAYLAYIVLCIAAISPKSFSYYLFYNGWAEYNARKRLLLASGSHSCRLVGFLKKIFTDYS